MTVQLLRNFYYDNWKGVKLIYEEPDADTETFTDTLHDGFFETYKGWKKLRGDKEWKLDTYDE